MNHLLPADLLVRVVVEALLDGGEGDVAVVLVNVGTETEEEEEKQELEMMEGWSDKSCPHVHGSTPPPPKICN